MLAQIRAITCLCLMPFLGMGEQVHAELNWNVLQGERLVSQGDWLRLKLEVLALRLSYPAYRVSLELSEIPSIHFTFVASGGMAKHVTEEIEREAAEQVLSYHAQGIRDQLEKLLKEEFPMLWERFNRNVDFSGEFMGPGEEWSDPPRLIGEWKQDTYTWAP